MFGGSGEGDLSLMILSDSWRHSPSESISVHMISMKINHEQTSNNEHEISLKILFVPPTSNMHA